MSPCRASRRTAACRTRTWGLLKDGGTIWRDGVFYRMGFDDREIVALSGAHALGRCHPDASGYDGPWTPTPTTLNNGYYSLLLNVEWTPRDWDGPFQYEDPSEEAHDAPRICSCSRLCGNHGRCSYEDDVASMAWGVRNLMSTRGSRTRSS